MTFKNKATKQSGGGLCAQHSLANIPRTISRLRLHLNTDVNLLTPISAGVFLQFLHKLTAQKYREACNPCGFSSLKVTKNVNALELQRYNYWRNTHRLKLTNRKVEHKNDLLFNSLGKHKMKYQDCTHDYCVESGKLVKWNNLHLSL